MLSYKTFFLSKDAKWLTFVHGAGGSSTIWYKQVKALKPFFNLLLIDLRGHGKSNKLQIGDHYTLDDVTDEIAQVCQHLKICKSHFMGVSLGSILIAKLSHSQPQLIDRVVLSGAITSFDPKTRFLLWLFQCLKNILPNMLLYSTFAWIVMPKKNHKSSRQLFVREAKKIKHKAFRKWLRLLPEIKTTIENMANLKMDQPVLFISGQEDYLFINQIEEYVKDKSNCVLQRIQQSGHIVNIDQYKQFNQLSLRFLE